MSQSDTDNSALPVAPKRSLCTPTCEKNKLAVKKDSELDSDDGTLLPKLLSPIPSHFSEDYPPLPPPTDSNQPRRRTRRNRKSKLSHEKEACERSSAAEPSSSLVEGSASDPFPPLPTQASPGAPVPKHQEPGLSSHNAIAPLTPPPEANTSPATPSEDIYRVPTPPTVFAASRPATAAANRRIKGWPDLEPIEKAPATKNRKSRFFPNGRNSSSGGGGGGGGGRASSGAVRSEKADDESAGAKASALIDGADVNRGGERACVQGREVRRWALLARRFPITRSGSLRGEGSRAGAQRRGREEVEEVMMGELSEVSSASDWEGREEDFWA